MSIYIWLVFTFGLSLAFAFLFTPLMRRIAIKKGILSKPGRRMVHAKPVPYLGGLAIYFAFVAVVLVVFYANQQFRMEFAQKLKGLLIGGTLIVMLGVWDDIKNIRPIIKLIGQIAVALLLFGYGFRIEVLTNPFFGGEIQIPLFISVLFTVGWIVGLINAMNLIDGLDGLAAGITIIVSAALFFIALFLNNYITCLLLAALAGSALGFLRFNFYPAKIFMGDAGSMFIGLILASVVLIESQYKSATAVVLMVPITALAIPIFDTSMAMLRRILRKAPIFQADKEHLHHRLLNMGLSHKRVVLFLYFICGYFGIIAFLFVLISNKYAFILLILLGMGVFMGVRTVGFIERKVRVIHRMQKKLNKNNR